MKRAELITPTQGWALSETQLMLTDNAGDSWKDITPSGVAQGLKMVEVFFRTPEQGWVLLLKDTPDGASWNLVLSVTADQGASWQDLPVAGIPADGTEDYGGGAFLDFVTPQHGWLLLRYPSNTAFNSGTLYETEDGGRTWLKLPGDGVYGAPRFQPDGTGYLTALPDGPYGYELYHALDGGRTWVKLKLPDLANSDQYRDTLSEPHVHGNRITLARTITHADQNDIVEILRSEDGGATWNTMDSFSALPDYQSTLTFAEDDGTAVQAFQAADRSLAIRTGDIVHAAGLPQSWVGTASVKISVSSLSFPNARTGWLQVSKWQCGLVGCTSGTWLLRTQDGGATVQAITIPFKTTIVWSHPLRRGLLK